MMFSNRTRQQYNSKNSPHYAFENRTIVFYNRTRQEYNSGTEPRCSRTQLENNIH